jgi:hypothetical protein
VSRILGPHLDSVVKSARSMRPGKSAQKLATRSTSPSALVKALGRECRNSKGLEPASKLSSRTKKARQRQQPKLGHGLSRRRSAAFSSVYLLACSGAAAQRDDDPPRTGFWRLGISFAAYEVRWQLFFRWRTPVHCRAAILASLSVTSPSTSDTKNSFKFCRIF